jgi:FkbM family methyltransferase
VTERVRIKDFGGNGLRIAYREGTMDERAVAPWIEWLRQPTPTAYELRPDEVVLDVGAHIGGFTLLASSLVPEGRVLAVEACRESYEMLIRNIELNELTNVAAAHLALSDRRGETYLHYSEAGNWAHTITKSTQAGGEPVRTETLTDYLHDSNVGRCDLAKFNCEGAEFPILMNTPVKTLRTIRQMLIYYHADLVDEHYSLSRLEQHLEEAGFELECRKTSPARGRIAARRARG